MYLKADMFTDKNNLKVGGILVYSTSPGRYNRLYKYSEGKFRLIRINLFKYECRGIRIAHKCTKTFLDNEVILFSGDSKRSFYRPEMLKKYLILKFGGCI